MKIFYATLLAVFLIGNGPSLLADEAKLDENAWEIPQKTFVELAKKDGKFLLLDVRSKAEFAGGHIDGACNIDYRELPKHVAKGDLKAFKKQPVVVYCHAGHRAGIARKALLDQGFTNVRVLEGNFGGWVKNGRPASKGNVGGDGESHGESHGDHDGHGDHEEEGAHGEDHEGHDDEGH